MNWVLEVCVYEDWAQDQGGLHGLGVRGIYDFEMESYERHCVKGFATHYVKVSTTSRWSRTSGKVADAADEPEGLPEDADVKIMVVDMAYWVRGPSGSPTARLSLGARLQIPVEFLFCKNNFVFSRGQQDPERLPRLASAVLGSWRFGLLNGVDPGSESER